MVPEYNSQKRIMLQAVTGLRAMHQGGGGAKDEVGNRHKALSAHIPVTGLAMPVPHCTVPTEVTLDNRAILAHSLSQHVWVPAQMQRQLNLVQTGGVG
jgi:hypothetical protein